MTNDFLKRKRIGEILVEMRAITPQQLDAALKRQPSSRKMIGEILIEDKVLNEETLFRGLSTQHGIEFMNLSNMELNTELIRQIPESLIKTYKFIPIRKEPKSLTIAVFDPTNVKMFDSIKMATGYMFIKWVIAMKSQILHIINDIIYRPQNVLDNVPMDELLKDVKLEFSKEENQFSEAYSGQTVSDLNLEELKRESDQTSIVTLVHKIILDAVKMRASDIHIEAFEKIIQVRYRIDGILYDILPIERAPERSSRIKIMSNLDITALHARTATKLSQGPAYRVPRCTFLRYRTLHDRVLDSGRVNLDLKGLGFQGRSAYSITLPTTAWFCLPIPIPGNTYHQALLNFAVGDFVNSPLNSVPAYQMGSGKRTTRHHDLAGLHRSRLSDHSRGRNPRLRNR